MNAKEVLQTARAKISTPGSWTRSAIARTNDGKPTHPTDPDATCWCTLGAIEGVVPLSSPPACEALDLLRNAIKTPYISSWNDDRSRTQEEVLSAFDKAIASCP